MIQDEKLAEQLCYVEEKDQKEAWIILVDGKRLKTNKGKAIWTTKGAATNALRLQVERKIQYLSDKSVHLDRYKEARSWMKNYYKGWKDKHVKIIKKEEMEKEQKEWKAKKIAEIKEEKKRQKVGRWYNILEE